MKHGKTAEILTSDVPDYDRDKVIDDFRRQKFSALISTNLLARGIDVPDVDIVINYNIPVIQEQGGWQEPDYANYLHRVGRTGRFETDGLALTFYYGESEESMMQKIGKHWDTDIVEIKSFEEFAKIYNEMRPTFHMGGGGLL